MKDTCFFSGHRIISAQTCEELKPIIRNQISALVDKFGVKEFISGGALGFDTLCADTVIEMQEESEEFAGKVRLSLYLPCYDQEKKWSADDKYHFNMLKFKAGECRYITEDTYTSTCMKLRNFAMVDAAGYGIVYCTNARSGTGQTIRYAKEKNRTFVNLATLTGK